MSKLVVEQLIQSGEAPSFTEVTEPVIDLGEVTFQTSKVFNIDLPVNTFHSISLEGTFDTGLTLSILRTGKLTIDASSYSTEKIFTFYVVFTSGVLQTKVKYKFNTTPAKGDIVYITPGNYTFIVPQTVTSLTVLGIGAGGGGGYTWADSGGGGGCLCYINNLAVTPGEAIAITVPNSTAQYSSGNPAVIGSYISVRGGTYSQTAFLVPNLGGTVAPTGAGQGGHVSGQYGGGGGAGGYGSPSGTDARGGYSQYGEAYAPSPNSGAAGAGSGYNSSTYAFGGGGGVYPFGRGITGAAVPANTYGNSFTSSYFGRAGSNGENGASNTNSSETSNKGRVIFHGEGGRYGGGGAGGGTSVSNNSNFCKGAQGVVRISWGAAIQYPTSASSQSYTQYV